MSEKEASSVLTSENSGDFYAQKLGLAKEPEAVAVEKTPEPVAETQQSEPEAEIAKPTEETEKKPNPKLEKRFSELTKQREQARQEAERERQRARELEDRLTALEKGNQPVKVEDPDREPQPSEFTDAFEYARALAKYAADNALKNRDKIEAERKQSEERQKLNEAWKSKVEAAKSELPDYEDMVASSDITVSDQVRDAILESDNGAKILYHLAENPEIAEKINGLSVVSALREIGRIEAGFEKPVEVKPVVKRSNAPAPITPIRGGTNVDVPLTSDGEFTGTPAQWKELRRSGKIR
jgi:DNA repair exonuclease SbcCD ATPase subunit